MLMTSCAVGGGHGKNCDRVRGSKANVAERMKIIVHQTQGLNTYIRTIIQVYFFVCRSHRETVDKQST